MYKVNLFNTEWDLTLVRSHYTYGGGLAVIANTPEGECFAVLTVNLDSFNLNGDKEYAFIDTNNCPWAEKFLVDNNIAEPTQIIVPQGFCMYPLYKFDLTKLEEIE
jgi:hypothetical protein